MKFSRLLTLLLLVFLGPVHAQIVMARDDSAKPATEAVSLFTDVGAG